MKKHNQFGLKLIASFKLIKGILLFIVGIGAIALVHKDVAAIFARWVAELRIDPDNRFILSAFAHGRHWFDAAKAMG